MIFGQESTETISRKRAINCKNTWQDYRIQLLEIQPGLLRDRKQSGSIFFHFSHSPPLSHPVSLSLSFSVNLSLSSWFFVSIPSLCLFCSPDSLSYLSLYLWLTPATKSESLWTLISKVHHHIIVFMSLC